MPTWGEERETSGLRGGRLSAAANEGAVIQKGPGEPVCRRLPVWGWGAMSAETWLGERSFRGVPKRTSDGPSSSSILTVTKIQFRTHF